MKLEVFTRSGNKISLDADDKKLAPFKLKSGDYVKTSLGEARVVGICEDGFLWFQVNGERGVSFWDDINNFQTLKSKGIKVIKNPNKAPIKIKLVVDGKEKQVDLNELDLRHKFSYLTIAQLSKLLEQNDSDVLPWLIQHVSETPCVESLLLLSNVYQYGTSSISVDKQKAAHYFSQALKLLKEKAEANKTIALHLAIKKGYWQIAKYILKEECMNIDVADRKGNTPLHIACLNKQDKIAQKLLERGASPHSKNNDGKTPFSLAASDSELKDLQRSIVENVMLNKLENLKELVAVHGANWLTYPVTKYGDSALHLAAKSENKTMRQFMMEALGDEFKFALTTVRNKQGQTAYELFVMNDGSKKYVSSVIRDLNTNNQITTQAILKDCEALYRLGSHFEKNGPKEFAVEFYGKALEVAAKSSKSSKVSAQAKLQLDYLAKDVKRNPEIANAARVKLDELEKNPEKLLMDAIKLRNDFYTSKNKTDKKAAFSQLKKLMKNNRFAKHCVAEIYGKEQAPGLFEFGQKAKATKLFKELAGLAAHFHLQLLKINDPKCSDKERSKAIEKALDCALEIVMARGTVFDMSEIKGFIAKIANGDNRYSYNLQCRAKVYNSIINNNRSEYREAQEIQKVLTGIGKHLDCFDKAVKYVDTLLKVCEKQKRETLVAGDIYKAVPPPSYQESVQPPSYQEVMQQLMDAPRLPPFSPEYDWSMAGVHSPDTYLFQPVYEGIAAAQVPDERPIDTSYLRVQAQQSPCSSPDEFSIGMKELSRFAQKVELERKEQERLQEAAKNSAPTTFFEKPKAEMKETKVKEKAVASESKKRVAVLA